MYPLVGDEAIMDQKAHGTTEKPVQKDLRWVPPCRLGLFSLFAFRCA